MSIQFAGSRSTGDRRRRRLVTNGDESRVDASQLDGDGAEIESQLVASEAAAPWVPVTEMRIWIYTALIGLLAGGLAFVLIRPVPFRPELVPLADHLLAGPRPLLVIFAQTLFLALSAQLGMLIGWYRARCRLDFGGRYLVWPWAVGLFAVAAFCVATDAHTAFGALAERSEWLPWRVGTVVWLLPCCIAALPITLLLDRDMRNSRSSLFVLRTAVTLWLAGAWLELYQPELQAQAWYTLARLLIPVFASTTLFVGLWHHARVVAYVCPDPPELEQRSAWSLLLAGCGWLVSRLVFRTGRNAADVDDEEAAKPKRRSRRKTDVEEATAKRKRKPAAKRAPARTRTRTRPADGEEVEESAYDESESTDEAAEQQAVQTGASAGDEHEEWAEEPEDVPARPTAAESANSGRFTQQHQAHASSVPAPHSRRQQPAWQPEAEIAEAAAPATNESEDESDEDRQFQLDSGMSADQMKGMSKRQKRDMKKQLRDQERTRGR
jgi:hypothetical protein